MSTANTTPLLQIPQGSLVGHLTPAINNPRDPRSLGRDSAEAFNILDNGMQDVIVALNQVANQDAKLPILIRDPLGNVVGTLGYTQLNNTAIYGLNISDQRGNPASFVGVQTEVPLPIESTTDANPDVIKITGHGYTNGDTVLIFGALGDDAINGIRIVENVTANTFTMTDLGGAAIAGNGAYSGGGFSERFFGGGKFDTVIIGANNQIRAFADGSVKINNATLTIDVNGATTTIGNIISGGVVVGVQVQNDAASSQAVQMTDHGFFIIASDGSHAVARMTAPGDNGFFRLDNLALTQQIQLNVATPNLLIKNAGGQSTVSPQQLVFVHGAATSTFAYNQVLLQDAGGIQQIVLDPIAAALTIGNGGVANSIIALDSVGATIGIANPAVTQFTHVTYGGLVGVDATGPWSLNNSGGLKLVGVQVVGQQLASVADVALVTTETAGAAYTATEQSMLNHLKTDVSSLKTQLNLWLNRARSTTGHGLIT